MVLFLAVHRPMFDTGQNTPYNAVLFERALVGLKVSENRVGTTNIVPNKGWSMGDIVPKVESFSRGELQYGGIFIVLVFGFFEKVFQTNAKKSVKRRFMLQPDVGLLKNPSPTWLPSCFA